MALFIPGTTYTATDGTNYINITSWKKMIGNSGSFIECKISEEVELVDSMQLFFDVSED